MSTTTTTTTTKRRNVRRRALIVGINEYQNPNNNLKGCVADAKDIAETLLIMGFPPTRIKLLINEQASTEGIHKGLEWLIKDTADGDVLIFSYSGHGSQVTDVSGDETTDQLDEIIVPWDISWRDKKYITDDQLFDYFTNRVSKGVRTDVMLDCCFAGTGTRSFGNGAVGALKLVDADTRSQRYLPPPVDQAFRISTMIPSQTDFRYFSKNLIEGGEGKPGSKSQVVNQNNVLWAACQDYQLAWELSLGGEIRGAFTYYLMRIIRRANGNITRGEGYSILRSSMYSDGFEQIPALEVPHTEAIELFPFRKASEIDQMSEIKVPKK